MLTRWLHHCEPERAHGIALLGLKFGLVPRQPKTAWPRLTTSIAGLDLPNPLGLAAGFDKNAEAVTGLARLGFGWLEIGTITPQPQAGNPRPRIFRLPQDRAVINRLGFNNHGLEAASRRLAKRQPHHGIIGANIGANKTSEAPINDYVMCLDRLYPLADYFTVNVSSPNTPGLRDLQGRAKLGELLGRLIEQRARHEPACGRKPLFLKLAPDLAPEDEADIADVVTLTGLDGLIISNTTLARPDELKDPNQRESGGLSGRPLFKCSTEQIRRFHHLTSGKLPLIGVGGIDSGARAYAKIKAGASAVQIYTGFVYGGSALIPAILSDLERCLEEDGFADLASAKGSECHPVAAQ